MKKEGGSIRTGTIAVNFIESVTYFLIPGVEEYEERGTADPSPSPGACAGYPKSDERFP